MTVNYAFNAAVCIMGVLVAKTCGGKLDVKSKNGKGTVVTVTFIKCGG